MKLPTLFTKVPKYKRFNYEPRFYDERSEEMLEREKRIRAELKAEMEREKRLAFPESESSETIDTGYRTRIAGSFRSSRRTGSRQNDPSASLIRLVILLFLVALLIGYLQFGPVAAYGLFLIVPFYLYLKFRGLQKREEEQ